MSEFDISLPFAENYRRKDAILGDHDPSREKWKSTIILATTATVLSVCTLTNRPDLKPVSVTPIVVPTVNLPAVSDLQRGLKYKADLDLHIQNLISPNYLQHGYYYPNEAATPYPLINYWPKVVPSSANFVTEIINTGKNSAQTFQISIGYDTEGNWLSTIIEPHIPETRARLLNPTLLEGEPIPYEMENIGPISSIPIDRLSDIAHQLYKLPDNLEGNYYNICIVSPSNRHIEANLLVGNLVSPEGIYEKMAINSAGESFYIKSKKPLTPLDLSVNC